MRLLIASNNPGKLREYHQMLLAQEHGFPSSPFPAATPIHVLSPADLGLSLHPPEIGTTYMENATLKAKLFASASTLPTLADDSGLEIDALNGEPGILSARYAGPTDADRIRAILAKLHGVPLPARTARFRAALALATPDGRLWTAEGTCEGIITFTPRGTRGFGYDPIFYLPHYHKTMAQIPASLKNRISHRARALAALRPAIIHLASQTPDDPIP